MSTPEPSVTSPYARTIDGDGGDSLSEIARRIPPGATVLDLGAATGALGRFLGEAKGCTVDVLELDLGTADLGQHFPARAYDAIVCADVLEHLRDPGRLLDQLPGLLAPGG